MTPYWFYTDFGTSEWKLAKTTMVTLYSQCEFQTKTFLTSFMHPFFISERGKFYTTRFGRSDPSLTRQVILWPFNLSVSLSVCSGSAASEGRIYCITTNGVGTKFTLQARLSFQSKANHIISPSFLPKMTYTGIRDQRASVLNGPLYGLTHTNRSVTFYLIIACSTLTLALPTLIY